jgi:methylated-DNA-[protein]-cysteine S-methyltransferase
VAADLIADLGVVPVGTPIGTLLVVSSDHGIVATAFEEGGGEVGSALDAVERALGATIGVSSRRVADRIRREVDGYFAGRPDALRCPIDLRSLDPGFGGRVLRRTMGIPFGEVVTYGDVAAAAGSPRGGRAAGNVLARCPIELWIPCHRVVHADGHIGGYGRHEDRKRFLLRHEGIEPGGRLRNARRRDVPPGPARD